MIRTGLAIVLALALMACTSSGSPVSREEQSELIEVAGRVTVTGSAPHVTLVIVSDDEYYELVGDLAEQLWDFQQRHVVVRGRVVRQATGLPGRPARLSVEEYSLN